MRFVGPTQYVNCEPLIMSMFTSPMAFDKMKKKSFVLSRSGMHLRAFLCPQILSMQKINDFYFQNPHLKIHFRIMYLL